MLASSDECICAQRPEPIGACKLTKQTPRLVAPVLQPSRRVIDQPFNQRARILFSLECLLKRRDVSRIALEESLDGRSCKRRCPFSRHMTYLLNALDLLSELAESTRLLGVLASEVFTKYFNREELPVFGTS